MPATTHLMAGVIEGFYGQPWSRAERFQLFDWMAAWGLNTYVYAPKDDLKHRTLWRELYSSSEAEPLAELIRACTQRNIRFIYALSPGLDIHYSSETEHDRLKARFEQMLALGCKAFALLFDDIPVRPLEGSLASAQCQVSNTLLRWTRERCGEVRFLFCPTPYCGRMAERKLGGEDYLPTVGRELLPEIDVFWTGPEIISQSIHADPIRQLQVQLRRKPVIWDNLHANDYDVRRFYCGPYSGRAPELRGLVNGFLSNPNNEFPLNFVPLRTLARFVHSEGNWDARAAYLAALREWLPHFATVGQPIALEDLILFGDCHYLPHEDGEEAEALYTEAKVMTPEFPKRSARLREFCVRLTELRDRPLFYALCRRVWELREELDLLEGYAAFRSLNPGTPFPSDSHLPGTYRGGFVPKLQRLLVQHPDGAFTS